MQLNEDSYCNREKERISQGDIIRNLKVTITSKINNKDEHSMDQDFSYGIILSQDCDIDEHYRRIKEKELEKKELAEGKEISSFKTDDPIIETILICPAFPLEQFLEGTHLMNKKMQSFGKTKKAFDKIKNNDSSERFYCISKLQDNFPELVIDFKRFYTIPLELFDKNFKKFYIISIKNLYREKISQRFTNYLGRIGLPD